MSKKIILKTQLDCEKCKRRAMKTVAAEEGVDSVQIDPKDNKITVIGDPDPVSITAKLRKFGWTELLSVGPAKEPEKPKPPPTEQPKKDAAPKKDEKKEAPNITYAYIPKPYCEPYGYCWSHENPNACTIS